MNNGTTEQTLYVYPIGMTIFIGVTTSMLSVLTSGGNLLVLITFAKDETLRVFSDYFLLNLAVADFIIGVFCIPPYIPYLLTGVWTGGKIFCKIWLVLDYVTPAASTLCMCIISIDRYLQVAHPIIYKVKQTPRLRLIMMLTPWIITVLTYFPAISFWEMVSGIDDLPETICRIPFYNNLPYLMFGAFVEFIMPLTVIASLNLVIFLNIRRRTKLGFKKVAPVETTSSQPQPTAGTDAPVSQISGNDQSGQKPAKSELRRDRKAARSLFILVFCFVVCWMPFEVMSMMSSVAPTSVDPVLFEVGFWILWINSALNPILYPFLHPRMRKAFLKLMPKCCR